MAYLGQTFNVADHVPSSPDPVPAGWYTAKITDAKVKDTKAGTGNFLEVTFSIIGPSYEGRCVWGRFNLKNPNPQAEQIGQAQFMDMARAIGLEVVDDSDQLLGGELDIKVTVKKGDEQYNDSNDVKGFKALQGMTVITQKPVQKPDPQPVGAGAPAKAATPPWAKK